MRSTADELGVSLNIGFANALTPSSGEAYNNKKKAILSLTKYFAENEPRGKEFPRKKMSFHEVQSHPSVHTATPSQILQEVAIIIIDNYNNIGPTLRQRCQEEYIYINIYTYIGKIPCLSHAFSLFHLNLDGHVHHILDFQNQCALSPENVEQLQE